MKINLSSRDIEVFLTLARVLSFSQAAQHVHLSQSALSSLIARLERDLGARLFERTTRSVVLTAAGEVLVEHARELTAQVDRTTAAVRDVTQLHRGSVSIAALPSLAAGLVPQLFRAYAEMHPGIRLSLAETLSEQEFLLVREKKVDFALVGADPVAEDLFYAPLASDGFVLLMPEAHPLAQGSAPVGFADALLWPHISLSLTTSMRQHVHATALRIGIQFTPRYEVYHLATIGAMVAQGLGVAALPVKAADVILFNGLVHKPIVKPSIRRMTGVLTRRDVVLSPAALEMVRLLAEQYHKPPKSLLPRQGRAREPA